MTIKERKKTSSRQNNFYRLPVQNRCSQLLRLAGGTCGCGGGRSGGASGTSRTCVVECDEILRHVHFSRIEGEDQAGVVELRCVQDQIIAFLVSVILHRLTDVL